MTLLGSYVDRRGQVVSVSVEATREGSYLVVKDRWRGPLRRDGATVEVEMAAPGNARTFAELAVLAHGGQLGQSAEALLCGRVVPQDGRAALAESRRATRTLARFMHVPAPGFGGGA